MLKRNYNPFNTLRLKLAFFIVAFPIIILASDATKVPTLIKKLENRFSEMASTKKVGTMGLDSMNSFFRTVIHKIPAVETLMRINSNGMVINQISSLNSEFPMRNVSDQKWFNHIKTLHLPYYGSNRDSSGNTSLFWAWPIMINDTIFSGAITARLKPSEIVKMASIKDSTPIKLSLNGSVFYKRNWLETSSILSDTVALSKGFIITVQTIADKAKSDTVTEISSEQTKSEHKKNDTLSEESSTIPKDSFAQKDTTDQQASEMPPVFTTEVPDKAPTPKKISAIPPSMMGILGCIGIITIIIVFKKKKRNKNDILLTATEKNDTLQDSNSIDASNSPVNVTEITPSSEIPVIPKIPQIVEPGKNKDSSTNLLAECEDETRELELDKKIKVIKSPKIEHENVPPSVQKESALEQKLRKEIYKEIHNQIMQWVVCESARLSGRIEDLNGRLNKVKNGDNPELEKIKNETQQISKEIELFKKHLTDKKI